jgi:hypothetical protein
MEVLIIPSLSIGQIAPLSFLLQDVTRDFYAVAETFFIENVADVVLNSAHAYLELCGYFFVTQTARNGKRNTILSVS